MNIARYRTNISREKLIKYRHDPDASQIHSAGEIRETSEQYYQSAVEVLDAIHQRTQKI